LSASDRRALHTDFLSINRSLPSDVAGAFRIVPGISHHPLPEFRTGDAALKGERASGAKHGSAIVSLVLLGDRPDFNFRNYFPKLNSIACTLQQI
jgi:hypothetical protein